MIMFITIFGGNFFNSHHPLFNIVAAVLPLTGMFLAYFCEVLFLFGILFIVVGNTLLSVFIEWF